MILTGVVDGGTFPTEITINFNFYNSKLSNDRVCNARGEKALEFISQNSFTLMNVRTIGGRPSHFTYCYSNCKSEIDFAWFSIRNLATLKGFKVMQDTFVSDNFAIGISLYISTAACSGVGGSD